MRRSVRNVPLDQEAASADEQLQFTGAISAANKLMGSKVIPVLIECMLYRLGSNDRHVVAGALASLICCSMHSSKE